MVRPTARSIRATQLFRTLLHEVGHHVDRLESFIRPIAGLSDQVEIDRIVGAYRSRPSRTKEDFAHRYAAEAVKRVPQFEQMLDCARLRADGLEPAWFKRD